MNSPETQSDSSSQETYFDPEVMDNSEQEFSASLEVRSVIRADQLLAEIQAILLKRAPAFCPNAERFDQARQAAE